MQTVAPTPKPQTDRNGEAWYYSISSMMSTLPPIGFDRIFVEKGIYR